MQQTVDVDVNLLLDSEAIPACGLSFCSAAAAAAEETEEAVLAVDVTACGSSFCSAAAAASETVFPETDADADLRRKNLH